jgi:hypothetical protein
MLCVIIFLAFVFVKMDCVWLLRMHQLYAPLKFKVVGKEPKTYLEKLLDILVGVHYYITLPPNISFIPPTVSQ